VQIVLFLKIALPQMGNLDVTLRRIPADGFDLVKSLNSGQVFHWTQYGRGFAGAIDQEPCYLEQAGNELLVSEGLTPRVRRYLALDHRIDDIHKTFPNDPTLKAAVRYANGIRILRQPVWECLATFLTSALKQVAHIRSISLLIRERYGTRLEIAGTTIFSYPAPEVLARLALGDLQACRLGFRAANLLAAARMVATGEIELDRLAKLPSDEIRHALCRFPGVGDKIANCVLLFAYGRLEVMPIDVWIARVLREKYFPNTVKIRPAQLADFCQQYFGPYAGYAQQYLFHHWRLTYRKELGARS
jgi:N-glycosylase/DNA lyase